MHDIIFLDFDGVITEIYQDLVHRDRRHKAAYRKALKAMPSPTDNPYSLRPALYYKYTFSPMNVSNLNFICKEMPLVRIVVSSTWRKNRTIPELQEILRLGGFLYPERVIGKTKSIYHIIEPAHDGRWERSEEVDRGYECQVWLDENKDQWKSFVIIDDDRDYAHLGEFFVWTNGYDGLQMSQSLEVMRKL
jgi:hypothetical protein